MCRNIRLLFNFAPPVTEDEIRAASLQFVRKISGFTNPRRPTKLRSRRPSRRSPPPRAGFSVRSRRASRHGTGRKRRPRRTHAPSCVFPGSKRLSTRPPHRPSETFIILRNPTHRFGAPRTRSGSSPDSPFRGVPPMIKRIAATALAALLVAAPSYAALKAGDAAPTSRLRPRSAARSSRSRSLTR
jgi:hypothetical protein